MKTWSSNSYNRIAMTCNNIMINCTTTSNSWYFIICYYYILITSCGKTMSICNCPCNMRCSYIIGSTCIIGTVMIIRIRSHTTIITGSRSWNRNICCTTSSIYIIINCSRTKNGWRNVIRNCNNLITCCSVRIRICYGPMNCSLSYIIM